MATISTNVSVDEMYCFAVWVDSYLCALPAKKGDKKRNSIQDWFFYKKQG